MILPTGNIEHPRLREMADMKISLSLSMTAKKVGYE